MWHLRIQGGAGPPAPTIFYFIMQFSGNFEQIFWPEPLWSQKSAVPPDQNPGSEPAGVDSHFPRQHPENRELNFWKFSFFHRKLWHVDEFWQKVNHSIGDHKNVKTCRQCMSLMEKTKFLFSPVFGCCLFPAVAFQHESLIHVEHPPGAPGVVQAARVAGVIHDHVTVRVDSSQSRRFLEVLSKRKTIKLAFFSRKAKQSNCLFFLKTQTMKLSDIFGFK